MVRLKTIALHSLFLDLLAYGSVRLKKSKLLWMLDRAHETPTAWDLLLVEWREFGQSRPLFGLNWNDEITLTVGEAADIAERWSARGRNVTPEVGATVPRAPFLPHVVA